MSTIRTSISKRELQAFIADPHTAFFLGAGASVSAGLPLGNTAARQIACSIIEASGCSKRWQKVVDHLDARSTQSDASLSWPRFEVMVGILAQHKPTAPQELLACFRDLRESSCQKALVAFSPRARLWLTTNFDDQIEAALARTSAVRIISGRKALRSIRRTGRHLVIKLHGDSTSAISPDGTATTIDQILRNFPRSGEQAIVRLLQGRPLLVVGYAARDPDLLRLLTNIVSRSARVIWVGKGPITDRIEKLLEGHPRGYYLAAGFDGSVCTPLGWAVTRCRNAPVQWSQRVKAWARSQDRSLLLRALTDLARIINSPESRKVALASVDEAFRHPDDALARYDRRLDIVFRTHPRRMREINAKIVSFEKSLDAAARTGDSRVQWLCALARARQRQGSYEKALPLLREALALAGPRRPFRVRFEAQRAFGRLAAFRGGDLFTAGLRALRQARTLALRKHEMVLALDCAEELAICLMRSNRAVQAERILCRCEAHELEIGSPGRLVSFYVNLAETRRIQNDFSSAVKILDRIRPMVDDLGDHELRINVYANSGLNAICSGEPAKASQLLEQTQALCGDAGFGPDADVCQNLGWLRLVLGCWKDAIPHFKQAYARYRDLGSVERAGASLAYGGWCWFELGKTDLAAQALGQIKQHKLLPRGLFAGDVELLRIFLAPCPPFKKYLRCKSQLITDPDIYFRGLAHLVSRHSLDLSTHQRREVGAALVLCAIRSHMPLLMSQADELLAKGGAEWSASRRKLQQHRYKKLSAYVDELPVSVRPGPP